MIYEETYNYLLHNVSSTEFDVILYSLLSSDWDGVVQAPLFQIASKIGTTVKYLKQIIKKFTSSKRRNIFLPVETEEGTQYQLNLGPTRNLGFNNKTDRYCKKYSFFYTENFRNLSINSKRLLLMSAFRMSILKDETVMINLNEIIPSTHSQGHPFFSRSRLIEAIKEIQSSDIHTYVSINLISNVFTRNEMVQFSFTPGTLNDFLSNYTERKMLRRSVFNAGFQGYLENSFCVEIEKVGKYLFNSLLNTQKSQSAASVEIGSVKDELIKLARFIYSSSIKKFSVSLHSNKHLLTEPKQASAYFSTIIYNEALNEMAKFAHQAESINSLLECGYLHQSVSKQSLGREATFIEVEEHIKPIRDRYTKAHRIYALLNQWCEEWIVSRVKSVVTDSETILKSSDSEETESIKEKRGWKDLQPALAYISNLKESVYEQIDSLVAQLSRVGNKMIQPTERTYFLKKHRESFSSYFAIQSDRLQMLIEK